MASHMTKLMRRLASAGLEPWFEVCVDQNTYSARVEVHSESMWRDGDTPETAITKAVDDAIAARRK